jgi:hypothetical protein
LIILITLPIAPFAVPPCLITTIKVFSKFGALKERSYYEIIWLQILKTPREEKNIVRELRRCNKRVHMFQCLVIYIRRDKIYYVHARARYIHLATILRPSHVCGLRAIGGRQLAGAWAPSSNIINGSCPLSHLTTIRPQPNKRNRTSNTQYDRLPLECQYRGGRAVRSKSQLSRSYISDSGSNVSQATVAVSGKAKDLAATISSGKSAQDEREAKRKAREEKERAEKEQEWKERQDREREKERAEKEQELKERQDREREKDK